MALARPADVHLRRSVLRAEEVRLATALSAVRTSLNHLSPISWLPTEILEQIFGLCVLWLYGHQKPKSRLAWTQVCRVWRQISFNSGRLWQCIDLCDSRLAHEFLIRSKTAPLSIISSSPLKLCIDNLHSHAERFESIEVYLFPDDVMSLFKNIGTNTVNLTTLSLKIPPISLNLYLDIPFPSVRRLSLDAVAVQWNMCQGLTHLSLRALGAGFSPSVSQLHTIFEASPRLEYIRLEDIAPAISTTTSDHTIPLCHVREMVIRAKSSVISAILAGISLPSHARLQLGCSLFQDLQSLLPSGIPHHQDKRINPNSTLRLARHATHLLRSGSRPWSEESTETLISLSSTSCVSKPVLSSLHTIIDLSHITTLELGTGVLLDITIHALACFLARTTHLETLRVAFNNIGELFSALSASPLPHASAEVLCPRLATLSFSKPGDMWWHFSEHWVRPLLACAQARTLRAAPLAKLEFIKCHGICPQAVAQLQHVVAEVVIPEPFECPA